MNPSGIGTVVVDAEKEKQKFFLLMLTLGAAGVLYFLHTKYPSGPDNRGRW